MSFIQLNTKKSYGFSTVEKIYFSAVILIIITVATTILTLQISSQLIMSHKIAVPVLTGYTLATALLVISLLSMVISKKHTIKFLNSSNSSILNLEEIENVEEPLVISDPFLEGNISNKIKSLKGVPNPAIEEEKQILHKSAKQKLIEAKKNALPIDWQQFALMNNTAFIKDSFFDTGHHTFSCLVSYIQYLSFLQKEKSFFSSNVEDQIWQEIKEVLEFSKIILSNFPRCVDKMFNNNDLKIISNYLLSLINDSLSKKGYIYFPAGYCGRDEASSAHAIACKIALDPQQQLITFSFLNLGEGVEHHPELTATTTHIKTSYTYYPVVIPLAFWKEIAPTFLSHLLRFISDLPIEKTNYVTQDLYDLLAIFQSFSIENIVKQEEKLAAKPQYVGDCSEKSIRNIITDFLGIEKQLPRDAIDILFLNLHFTSIISAYHSYVDSPQEGYRGLLINGCEEFANFLLRSKNFLKKEEYLEATEIIDIILHKTKLPPKVQQLPFQCAHSLINTLFDPSNPPDAFSFDNIKGNAHIKQRAIYLPLFNIASFRKDLEEFTKSTRDYDSFHSAHLNIYVRTFPIPGWNEQDVWNKIPIGDIPSIIVNFQIFLKRLQEAYDCEAMLGIFTLHAITDKLVRMLKPKELQTYALPTFFDILEQYLFFPLGPEQNRFQKIKAYFSQDKQKEIAILPYPNNWQKISPEMKTLLSYTIISIKLAHGKNFEFDELYQYTDWNEIYEAENKIWNHGCFERRLMRFLIKYKKFTSNDILCKPLNYKRVNHGLEQDDGTLIFDEWYQKKINKEILPELLLLLRNSQLQLGLVIQWIQTHFNELNQEIVQKIVELALFSSGALKAQIHERLDIVEEIRLVIEKGLTHYENKFENFPAILFLIQCGITLESYIADFSNTLINETLLKNYKIRLNELKSSLDFQGQRENEDRYYILTLSLHYFLGTLTEKYSSACFVEFFTNFFELHVLTSGLNFGVSYSLHQRYKIYNYHCFKHFDQFLEQNKNQKQELVNSICNTIMHNLTGCTTSHLSWHYDPLIYCCISDSYIFDFFDGSIRHKTTGHLLTSFMQYEREEQHHKEFNVEKNKFWWMSQINSRLILTSLDEHTVLIYSHHKTFLLKKNGINSSDRIALFNKESYEKYHFLNVFPFIYYFRKENDTQKDYILCCLKSTHKPFMRIDFLKSATSVKRLDEAGNTLPFDLANLKKLDATHPLFTYTLRFGTHKDIVCFIHETTQEIQELYFSNLNLSFKKNDKGLESIEFPGFFLIPLNIKALKTYSRDAMVLRNEEGKIKVILPFPKIEEKKTGFSNKNKKKLKTNHSLKYFIFDIDSLESPLICTKASEKLFLIYFFKVHEDYSSAEDLFKTLHTHLLDNEILKTLNIFLFLKDQTPLSIAFTQKILLFFVDHLHLIQGYENTTSKTIKNILSKACLWYENYLRITGDDRFNRVPIEWRLTEEEEFRIFSVMEREKIKLSKILKIRMELLLTENRSAEIEFTSEEICLVPKAFHKLTPPKEWTEIKYLEDKDDLPYGKKSNKTDQQDVWINYPNQVSETYCQFFFQQLYDQARKVPSGCKVHPFDFTLVALLRDAKKNTVGQELASLLFYVRHFPNYFISLPASKTSNKAGKNTFNKILTILYQLQTTPDWDKLHEHAIARKDSFPYEKKLVLTLPPKIQNSPSVSLPLDPLHINPKPFEDCLRILFTSSLKNSNFGNEILFEDSLFGDNSLEKEIVAKYEKAYQQLIETKKKIHTIQFNRIKETKASLTTKKQDYCRQIDEEKKNILESINNPFNTFHNEFSIAEEKEFRLKLNAHQTYLITPKMIMEQVILKDSYALLHEHRPMLKNEHILAIINAVNRYYHLKVLASLSIEALDLLEKIEHYPENATLTQDLLNILNYEFLYSPENYPEISYMKVKTGKLPRKEQAIVYQWVCDGLEKNENRLFQLSAGGGKTSYLIPLMVLRAQRHQLTPFVLTTQAMYGIEKENLKNTLSLFGLELDTLEIGMDTRLNIDNLNIIYQQLICAVQTNKAVIITPQTYYALRLNYFTAISNGEGETSNLLYKILNFFKNCTLLLGDESHRNFDPMTQAIYGVGNFESLEKKEQILLMELAKPLFGIQSFLCGNGKALSTIVQSKETGKGKPSKLEIQYVQKELSKYILNIFFKDIPESEHVEIMKFWLNKKATEPPYLSVLKGSERNLILLGRYFFITLLKQIVQMKTDLDHVRSESHGGIDTPAYNKTPSFAQFKDPYLTFLLSIKGTWHRGLEATQFKTLIEFIKKQDLEERELALNIDQTPSQLRFKKWIEAKFPKLTLNNFDMTNKKLFEEVFAFCSKEPSTLEYFLSQLVLSNVGYSSEQFTSSPAHLMDGFKCSVIFSATPLSKMANPKALKDSKNDELFEAQVIAQSSKHTNQNFIFPDNIADFFEHIKTNFQKYSHVRHMIDASGFLCHESNFSVAKKWLDSSHLDGIIFFKDGTGSFEEKLILYLKNSLRIEFCRMEDLKNILPAHGVNLNELKIGIFFDVAHSESAHFDPVPKSAAFIFGGDALTLSHAIQAIMRERGFLNDTIDQRIIWVIQKDLKAKMQGKCKEFSSSIIHSWCLKNEVKSIKTAIIMAAFQDIIFEIESFALQDKGDIQRCVLKYADGFKEKVVLQSEGSTQRRIEKTNLVLWQFAKKHYERFNFPILFDQNEVLKKAISQRIQEVHEKIAEIFIDFQKNSVSEIHQKCVIKKQMRTIQYQNNPVDAIPEPIIKHRRIKNKDYLSTMKDHSIPICQAFNTPHLTKNFYIESNQIDTASRNGIHLKENFLKTIDFILIIIRDGVWVAEAISNDVLPKYIKHLKQNFDDKGIEHQAFIIRADGILYIKGTGILKPSESIITEIMSSQWLQDVLIDVALLKGKILYNERFKERICQWPDFLEFWDKILKALPLKKQISVNALLAFLPLNFEISPRLINN